jgi:hypothetical protein
MVIAWVTDDEEGAHGAGWYVVDGLMQKVAWDHGDRSTWRTDYNMRGDAFLADYKRKLKKAQDYHDEQLQLDGGGGGGGCWGQTKVSLTAHEQVVA